MTSATAIVIGGIASLLIGLSLAMIGGPMFLAIWFTSIYLLCLAAIRYHDSK